jgi:hypothetical protein
VVIDFWLKFYFKLLFPVFMAVGMMITFLTQGFAMKYLSRKYPSRFDNGIDYVRTAHKRIINIFGTLVTGLYTPVFSTALEPFDCRLKSDGSYVMGKNPSQNCYDDRWKANSPIFISLLVLYGFCLPVGLGYGLYRKRHERHTQDFKFKYAVFINAYDSKTYWWELVSLLKRASFFLVTGFFYNISQSTRFISAIAILFFFLTLELSFMPYMSRYLNVFSQGWTMIAIAVLASNALLFSFSSLPDDSRKGFDLVLVLIIILSLVWTLMFIGIRLFKREPRYTVTEQNLDRFSLEEKFELYRAFFQHESLHGNLITVEHEFMKEVWGLVYENLGRKIIGQERFDMLELRSKKIALLPSTAQKLFFRRQHARGRFVEINLNTLPSLNLVSGSDVSSLDSLGSSGTAVVTQPTNYQRNPSTKRLDSKLSGFRQQKLEPLKETHSTNPYPSGGFVPTFSGQYDETDSIQRPSIAGIQFSGNSSSQDEVTTNNQKDEPVRFTGISLVGFDSPASPSSSTNHSEAFSFERKSNKF